MNYLDALIIGMIEGLTEFLPISSTGHMIVVSDFLGLQQDGFLTSFEVIIQFGAILAVLMYYRQRMTMVVHLWKQLFVAFVPIAVIGLLFADYIKVLFSVHVVAWAFIVGGIVFLIVEKWYGHAEREQEDDQLHNLSLRQAILIGGLQILSLIPGTSRAGATIIGGMLAGLSRRTSTEFSFLLAIPVLGAVALYDSVRYYDVILDGNVYLFLWGFMVSFVVAYGSILFLIRFLERFSFVVFGWYRILFGIFLVIFFVSR